MLELFLSPKTSKKTAKGVSISKGFSEGQFSKAAASLSTVCFNAYVNVSFCQLGSAWRYSQSTNYRTASQIDGEG